MIAVWMAYTLLSGMLIAFACWLLEHMARSVRISTRGIWAGGMIAMLVISASPVVREHSPPSAAPRTGAVEAPSQITAAAHAWSGSQGLFPRLRQQIVRVRISLDAGAVVAAERLSRWDLPLLVLWAVSAAFLGGIVAHAAFEGRRLRYGLEPHEVTGVPVLLTDEIGPSAIGGGGPAILLPRWALDLDDPLLTLILRHEREHLAARDPLLLLAGLLAVVLLPWHLPLWWNRKRLRLAVEVDCDGRVLRAHPDVRRYAQLLLLAAQRAPKTAWASLAVVTVVAPLQPLASHLARRISAMTQPRGSRVLLRSIPLVAGVAAILSLIVVLPAPRRAQAQGLRDQARVLVHVTSMGWKSVDDSPPSILIYTTGGGEVGIGTDPPRPIADTLRLDRLSPITADVTNGDVHVQVNGPGIMTLRGDVTGGPARHVSATGRHIVIAKGGTGIEGKP